MTHSQSFFPWPTRWNVIFLDIVSWDHMRQGHPSTQHPAPGGTALDWVLRWSCNRIRRVLCSTSTSRSFLATTSPKQVAKSMGTKRRETWTFNDLHHRNQWNWRDFTSQNQRFQEQNPGGPGPPGLRGGLSGINGSTGPVEGWIQTPPARNLFGPWEMGISSKEIAKQIAMAIYG